MSEYITTYTGLHFRPTEPDSDLIRIQDIAHALSLICREMGMCRHSGLWESIVSAVQKRQQREDFQSV